MNCPACGLPLLEAATTQCQRCGHVLGEGGPVNLPRDPTDPWPTARKAINIVLIALLLWWVVNQFVK